MDIVVPFRNSSSNGLELRYMLRGLERYFGELENVFIVGDCPGDLHNVIHIPYADSSERYHKQRNIRDKLLLACGDKRVSDRFAWVSDDQFLLQPYVPGYDYRATLPESIQNFMLHQSYRLTLLNTFGVLDAGYDYGHYPMVLEKERFARAMAFVDWDIQWGYAIKSLYCGLNGITGNRRPDLKVKQPMIGNHILRMVKDQPYFSIADRGLNEDMKGVLQILFPQKSKYEID